MATGPSAEADMNANPTVPVKVTPQAQARLAELGMQAQLEQMLEHVLRNVPRLTHIDVELLERYDTGGEPGVSINAWRACPWQEAAKVWWDLAGWVVTTFPPQV